MTTHAFGTQVMTYVIWDNQESEPVQRMLTFGWTVAEQSINHTKRGTAVVTVLIRVVSYTGAMEPTFIHLTKQ